MKISMNWLNEYVDCNLIQKKSNLDLATLTAELLTDRGLEVEEITREDQGLSLVITGHILVKDKHPESDRLSYCQVDVGLKEKDGSPKVLNIICGATNHKAGDKVVVAMIGAELPIGLKIGRSKIRGVESEGMLCSESELGFSKESAGIIILPPSTEIGQPIAKVLQKDDVLLTLKLYANQGHLLSHIGVARECAAALAYQNGKHSPETYFSKKQLKVNETISFNESQHSPLKVSLTEDSMASQFYGVAIEGVTVGESPQWLKKKLESIGSRSINNIVDITNLILFETGHPVHAYDLKTLEGGEIHVRKSVEGESLKLLDGTTISLTGKETVIADAKRAIGLAGVMGGEETEVKDGIQKSSEQNPSVTQTGVKTTSIFLECAEFNPSLVREAKSRFQKLTEAASRFEKGIDSKGLEFVMRRMTHLILECAGGKVVGTNQVIRTNALPKKTSIQMSKGFCQKFLGLPELLESEVIRILKTLECEVIESEQTLEVIPPSYRLDLKIKEDLSEEIARSVGYSEIPATLPPLTSAPLPRASGEVILLNRAKDYFVKAGLSEALNYSFMSEASLNSLGLKSSLKLLNPLSEEYASMVPSLLPGLLFNLQNGFRKHFGSETMDQKCFEIRPTFHAPAPSETGEFVAVSEVETGVEENWKASFILTGNRVTDGLRVDQKSLDFYDVKAMVQNFFEGMGTKGVRLIKLTDSRTKRNEVEQSLSALFHPGVTAEVLLGNDSLGFFGLLHPKVSKQLKFKQDVFIGEFDYKKLTKMSRDAYQAKTYAPWNETPAMERDFAFVVDEKVTADQLISLVTKASKPLSKSVKIFDVYKGAPVPEGKASVAVRVIFQEKDRALTEAEVEPLSKAIMDALKKELNAELR